MVCGGGDVSGHKEDFPDFHQARTSEGQDRKPRIPGDGGRGWRFCLYCDCTVIWDGKLRLVTDLGISATSERWT